MAGLDIRELVEGQGDLLASILAASSGPLGELLAARALRRYGCEVAVLSNNWRQRDLRVTTPKGRTLFVETKTVRKKGACWIVNAPPDPDRSQIWILVHAPRAAEALPREDDVQLFVLTGEEALSAWKKSSPARNPKATIQGDIRWASLPEGCENAFYKLDA